MNVSDVATEIALDITAEQTRRDQLISHFAAAMSASLEHEARLRARLDQLPADGVVNILDPIVKDTRSAPTIVSELLDLAGRDGLTGAELKRQAMRRGLKANAIEQAKQRLKKTSAVLEQGVWRHKRFAIAAPAQGPSSKPARKIAGSAAAGAAKPPAARRKARG